VAHPLARAVLGDLQGLRKRAPITSPSLILSEAIEKLSARVIMAARYRNRNARALANLDALIERARPYGVSGLRAFVRDLQAAWEQRTKISEGRIDAAEDAVEFVTIHSAKGLEWPVVIPINSTTQLRRADQFVYRQSDNSLHWMLGGVAPPELAQARAEEGEEEARQRERVWYVACTRARDLLILPNIPQAVKASWFSASRSASAEGFRVRIRCQASQQPLFEGREPNDQILALLPLSRKRSRRPRRLFHGGGPAITIPTVAAKRLNRW
jgi:CRISPR-associated exonuclease Cas4